MDDTDIALVTQLRKNARHTYAELARMVGLSPPAVHDRVAKLETSGVITGYTAQVNTAALGLGVTAVIGVLQSSDEVFDTIVDELAELAEVDTCWCVAGEEAFQVLVRVPDIAALEQTIGRINRIKGVSRTRTTVVLSTKWQGRHVPPPDLGS